MYDTIANIGLLLPELLDKDLDLLFLGFVSWLNVPTLILYSCIVTPIIKQINKLSYELYIKEVSGKNNLEI